MWEFIQEEHERNLIAFTYKRPKDLPASEERYYRRVLEFVMSGKKFPLLRHKYEWLWHNCVIHPLLGMFPGKFTVHMHDRSSAALNNSYFGPYDKPSSLPKITNSKWWLLHNCVAHFLIGILPMRWSFRYHDNSATKMNVEGWI